MATDSLTSARAEFSGIMIIDSVTAAPGKPKTLYITGAFYAGTGIMLGLFKYFNRYDHVIGREDRYFFHATVRSRRIYFISHN